MPIKIVEDAPAPPSRVRVIDDTPPRTSQSLGALKGAAKVVGNLGMNLPRYGGILPNAAELAGMFGKSAISRYEQKENVRAGKTGQALAEILLTLPTMMAGPVMGGAAQGILTSDAPRSDVLGRARDAAIGAALGKAGEVGGKAIAKTVGKVVKPPPIVNTKALESAKDTAYDAVEQSGVKYAPRSLAKLNQTIATNVARDFDPGLHPRVGAVVSNLQSRFGSGPLSIKELDQARRFVRSNIFDKAATDEERRLGQMIIDDIDDFVNGATVTDVVGGTNPAAAAASINRARDLNTRLSKVEKVENSLWIAKNRADTTGSGGNIDNATRQEMRKILETSRNLSDEEKRILQAIVSGEKMQNVLRMIGKLSPSAGALPAWLNVFAASVNAPFGLVTAGAGAASKIAADKMTQGRVQDLMRVMAAGGQPVAATGGFSPQVLNAAGRAGAVTAVQGPTLAEALRRKQ